MYLWMKNINRHVVVLWTIKVACINDALVHIIFIGSKVGGRRDPGFLCPPGFSPDGYWVNNWPPAISIMLTILHRPLTRHKNQEQCLSLMLTNQWTHDWRSQESLFVGQKQSVLWQCIPWISPCWLSLHTAMTTTEANTSSLTEEMTSKNLTVTLMLKILTIRIKPTASVRCALSTPTNLK